MTRLGADDLRPLKEKTGKLSTRMMEAGKKRMLQASDLAGPILICYLRIPLLRGLGTSLHRKKNMIREKLLREGEAKVFTRARASLECKEY